MGVQPCIVATSPWILVNIDFSGLEQHLLYTGLRLEIWGRLPLKVRVRYGRHAHLSGRHAVSIAIATGFELSNSAICIG